MAIKFEKIYEGQILWDLHKRKMGNTTMSTIHEYEVRVVKVEPSSGVALVSWNGNPPEKWRTHQIKKLFANRPLLVYGIWGSARRANSLEKALWKEGKLESKTNIPSPKEQK